MHRNALDIVNAYYAVLDTEGITTAAQWMTDDFKFFMGAPQPLDKRTFIGAMRLLLTALPDLKHTLSDIQVQDSSVTLTEHLLGTHTGIWDGSAFGAPVIQPSGRVVALSPAQLEFTVVGDRITQTRDLTPPSPESGLSGLLKALGGLV
jgi:hypothetical protein